MVGRIFFYYTDVIAFLGLLKQKKKKKWRIRFTMFVKRNVFTTQKTARLGLLQRDGYNNNILADPVTEKNNVFPN